MGRIERLLSNYERFISIRRDKRLAGAEKVWFAVYDKSEERRLRSRIGEFEIRTRASQHGWYLVDLSNAFAEWMSTHEYRDSYFESPKSLDPSHREFKTYCINKVNQALLDPSVNEQSVVAIVGVASVFGFCKVSEIIEGVSENIRGWLLVFFPGEYENNNYRLLDARDGWNYLAVPITSESGELGW